MSDVEAGKAHVKSYMDNSLLVKGLKQAEGAFQGFGERLAAIGGRMTGIGDAIGLTVGHEFASKLLKTVAGATIGAAIAAPLGLALGKVFKSGAGATFLIELLKLRDQVAAVLEDVANALMPPLTAALRIVTGIVSATAGWLASHRQLVVTAAQIASTVFTIGAALAVIGKSVSFAGSGFGFLAKTIPAIAAFLASPLGIVLAIAAAIGGAAYAWVKFTDSGQAAAKFLMDFFGPTIKWIKDLVGGIGDALMAGDLALAGQIAVTGLQVVFLQGVNAIADAMGGVLGDFFASVATDLIQGDFKGAWETTLQGMAALWDALAAGLVGVFKAAIDEIITLWNSLNTGITGTLSALRAVAQIKGFNEIADLIGKAQGGLQLVAPKISNALAGASTAAGAIKPLLDKQAGESGGKFGARVAGGSKDLDDELAKKQAELTALEKKAAKERAGLKDVELPDKQSISAVAGGFSAAGLALQLQGGAGGPQKQIADAAKKQVELLREGNGLLDKVVALLGKFGFAP